MRIRTHSCLPKLCISPTSRVFHCNTGPSPGPIALQPVFRRGCGHECLACPPISSVKPVILIHAFHSYYEPAGTFPPPGTSYDGFASTSPTFSAASPGWRRLRPSRTCAVEDRSVPHCSTSCGASHLAIWISVAGRAF